MLQILSVFILGLIGGANPGPILTSSFTESIRVGFIKSLNVILMALISETIVAGFILTLFFSIQIPQIVFYIISLAGAVVLIWLATQVWKIRKIDSGNKIFTFKKIFILTVFNGPFWIFWITIAVPQAFLLQKKIFAGQILFLLLFELGWLFATVGLVFLFSRFRVFLTKSNFITIVFKIMALILLFFALKLTLESITFFKNS